ncbi:hypothetical protein GCM10022393_34310 [Aquimarina addita]|uniref:Peptidase C51 domain-containing protein n=1 Tax=Aquimarina addita TaxID=870485 RepID=A0ABP6UU04_9FLAO
MRRVIVCIAVFSLLLSCKENNDSKGSDRETIEDQKTTIESSNDDTEESIPQKAEEDIPEKAVTDATGVRATVTEKQLESTVLDFQNCKSVSEKRSDCRNKITSFMGKVYKANEFKDRDQNYMIYDSIQPIVTRSRSWSNIGSATDQNAIDTAQEHANNGGLAIIIDTSQSYGHVVVVQSGTTKKSRSWGLHLPLVVSLANHKPSKSFYNKSMAYAFQKSEDLQVYIRK